MNSMFDIDTLNTINKEEEKLALDGAYPESTLVGSELHELHAEAHKVSQEIIY